jgi:hypothetical protein
MRRSQSPDQGAHQNSTRSDAPFRERGQVLPLVFKSRMAQVGRFLGSKY